MKDFHPTDLGPIARPIYDVICKRLATLGPYPAYLDAAQLVDDVAFQLLANPRTVASMIERTRRFGLTYGIRRIRPTTLGRAWLNHHEPRAT